MAEIDYKKKCEEYEKILGVGNYDIERSAFFALCRMADLQTQRLNNFNLESEIKGDPKEDKVYDRTMKILENIPKMISDINSLRRELNIGRKDIEQQFTKQRTTPESIANVLGNTTGE